MKNQISAFTCKTTIVFLIYDVEKWNVCWSNYVDYKSPVMMKNETDVRLSMNLPDGQVKRESELMSSIYQRLPHVRMI